MVVGGAGPGETLVERLAHEWVSQYSRFRRLDAELTSDLRERDDEFEMVPIPRVLMQFLATPDGVMTPELEAELRAIFSVDEEYSEQRVPSLLGLGAAPRRKPEPAWLWQVARELSASLERGDLDACARMLAEGFQGPGERSRGEVLANLAELFAQTRERRAIPLDLSVLSLGDDRLEAELDLAWQAAHAEAGKDAAMNAAAGASSSDLGADDVTANLAGMGLGFAERLTCLLRMGRRDGRWQLDELQIA